MTDFSCVWETLDSLFKTAHRQNRRVEQLEARIIDLERRLDEQVRSADQMTPMKRNVSEFHTGRAA